MIELLQKAYRVIIKRSYEGVFEDLLKSLFADDRVIKQELNDECSVYTLVLFTKEANVVSTWLDTMQAEYKCEEASNND